MKPCFVFLFCGFCFLCPEADTEVDLIFGLEVGLEVWFGVLVWRFGLEVCGGLWRFVSKF
jgi:hypothetical protein